MKLSVVIPAYNEASRILPTLVAVQDFIFKKYKPGEAEIIVVDDGSEDTTKKVVGDFKHARLISLSKNRGKGYAVREGIRQSLGEYILFMDADSSTPITELPKLLEKIDGHDIVIGSRYSKNLFATTNAPFYRKIITVVGRGVIHMLIPLHVQDTQCGFKLFKRDKIQCLLPYLSIDGFGFDIEMLAYAKKSGYRIAEVPVVWNHAHGSRFHLIRDTYRSAKEIIKISLKVRSIEN